MITISMMKFNVIYYSMDESVEIGDNVCYGQQIIFTTLPGEGGEVNDN